MIQVIFKPVLNHVFELSVIAWAPVPRRVSHRPECRPTFQSDMSLSAQIPLPPFGKRGNPGSSIWRYVASRFVNFSKVDKSSKKLWHDICNFGIIIVAI